MADKGNTGLHKFFNYLKGVVSLGHHDEKDAPSTNVSEASPSEKGTQEKGKGRK